MGRNRLPDRNTFDIFLDVLEVSIRCKRKDTLKLFIVCRVSCIIFMNPLPEQPCSTEASATLKHSIMGRGGRDEHDEDDGNVVPGAGLRIPNM